MSATSQHFIIGTAGHVDHGKTALIRALTGVETDRLREERERGMSIDLGFAAFRLPSGREAGVIDVPGHERFLKNMLAGAGGIDLVLLVVAADEGVMPQTREHLDILHLLRTRRGIVVLTKADLVDAEWLNLVREDVRAALADSFLAGAPIVPVSSVTGAGLPELVDLLDRTAAEVPTRTILGPWRLPVDRVFTVPGFGTVITGTLTAGIARAGERVEILPAGREARIRGVEVHGAAVSAAEAGTRVALNLAGLEPEDVARGDVAAPPGAYTPTAALDVRLEVLASCPREVKHRTRVRVYLGAAEVLARLHLLDADTLQPGAAGLAQLRLESPTVAARGDRFVLRFYSPPATLGGGSVVDPAPARRHRRFDAAVLAALAVRESGTPAERLAEAVGRHGLTPVGPATLAGELGITADEAARLVEAGVAAGDLLPIGEAGVVHSHRVRAAEALLLAALDAFHAAHPMHAGMSREELRSRLARQLDSRGFALVLGRVEAAGEAVTAGGRVRRAGYQPVFTPAQERVRAALEAGLLRDPFNAPFYEDLVAAAGLSRREADEVWSALGDNGVVVRISAGVFLHREAVETAAARVREYLAEHGQMTAAQFRDLIGTTRKYAVPLMEHLDSLRVTRRVGDVRELA